MKLTIYDVGHGFCALLEHENGNTMLIDCGHKREPEYRPLDEIRTRTVGPISVFWVTNYDQDHISDIEDLVGG